MSIFTRRCQTGNTNIEFRSLILSYIVAAGTATNPGIIDQNAALTPFGSTGTMKMTILSKKYTDALLMFTVFAWYKWRNCSQSRFLSISVRKNWSSKKNWHRCRPLKNRRCLNNFSSKDYQQQRPKNKVAHVPCS